MPYLGGRSGGRGLGVLLLGAQMMNVGVENIPPVTLGAIVLQSAIFLQFGDLMKWFPNTGKVCSTKYTKQSDKELNTSLNDKIFVPPRDFINV